MISRLVALPLAGPVSSSSSNNRCQADTCCSPKGQAASQWICCSRCDKWLHWQCSSGRQDHVRLHCQLCLEVESNLFQAKMQRVKAKFSVVSSRHSEMFMPEVPEYIFRSEQAARTFHRRKKGRQGPLTLGRLLRGVRDLQTFDHLEKYAEDITSKLMTSVKPEKRQEVQRIKHELKNLCQELRGKKKKTVDFGGTNVSPFPPSCYTCRVPLLPPAFVCASNTRHRFCAVCASTSCCQVCARKRETVLLKPADLQDLFRQDAATKSSANASNTVTNVSLTTEVTPLQPPVCFARADSAMATSAEAPTSSQVTTSTQSQTITTPAMSHILRLAHQQAQPQPPTSNSIQVQAQGSSKSLPNGTPLNSNLLSAIRSVVLPAPPVSVPDRNGADNRPEESIRPSTATNLSTGSSVPGGAFMQSPMVRRMWSRMERRVTVRFPLFNWDKEVQLATLVAPGLDADGAPPMFNFMLLKDKHDGSVAIRTTCSDRRLLLKCSWSLTLIPGENSTLVTLLTRAGFQIPMRKLPLPSDVLEKDRVDFLVAVYNS